MVNERIKQLAEQARKEYLKLPTGYRPEQVGLYRELMEKFAELIVRECADIAYKTSWDDLVHGYGQAVIPLHLHNTIKQHFGVEE